MLTVHLTNAEHNFYTREAIQRVSLNLELKQTVYIEIGRSQTNGVSVSLCKRAKAVYWTTPSITQGLIIIIHSNKGSYELPAELVEESNV